MINKTKPKEDLKSKWDKLEDKKYNQLKLIRRVRSNIKCIKEFSDEEARIVNINRLNYKNIEDDLLRDYTSSKFSREYKWYKQYIKQRDNGKCPRIPFYDKVEQVMNYVNPKKTIPQAPGINDGPEKVMHYFTKDLNHAFSVRKKVSKGLFHYNIVMLFQERQLIQEDYERFMKMSIEDIVDAILIGQPLVTEREYAEKFYED